MVLFQEAFVIYSLLTPFLYGFITESTLRSQVQVQNKLLCNHLEPHISTKKFKVRKWYDLNAFAWFSPSSPFPLLFRNIGEFRAKQYFTDHRTPNTIKLFATMIGNVSDLFFF